MRFYEEMLCYLKEVYPMESTAATDKAAPYDTKNASAVHLQESWCIAKASPFYYMENARNGVFYGKDGEAEIARDWNRFLPITQIFSRIEFEVSAPDPIRSSAWNMGLKIDAPAADRFPILKNEYVHLIDPGQCLIYQFSGLRERKAGDDALQEMLEVPLSICRKHQFSMKNEVYIFNIFGSTMEPEDYVRETVLIPLG